MLVKLKEIDGSTIYVNPFAVQTVTEENDKESRIAFCIGEYSEIVVRGGLNYVVEKINQEAEKTLKPLEVGSVENLTIN